MAQEDTIKDDKPFDIFEEETIEAEVVRRKKGKKYDLPLAKQKIARRLLYGLDWDTVKGEEGKEPYERDLDTLEVTEPKKRIETTALPVPIWEDSNNGWMYAVQYGAFHIAKGKATKVKNQKDGHAFIHKVVKQLVETTNLDTRVEATHKKIVAALKKKKQQDQQFNEAA